MSRDVEQQSIIAFHQQLRDTIQVLSGSDLEETLLFREGLLRLDRMCVVALPVLAKLYDFSDGLNDFLEEINNG